MPAGYDDVAAAPLLCAGIVGYRALKRAALPPGGRLGIWGFGASAHLVAQVAVAQGAEVFVVTRSPRSQQLARELGAAWVGGPDDPVPVPLDAGVVFAPAGEVVPRALAALDRGAVLSLAGIHMTPIPTLDHDRLLFGERELRSTTANTRADGEEFLRLAERLRLRVETVMYPMAAADRALRDLAEGAFSGAAVLVA